MGLLRRRGRRTSVSSSRQPGDGRRRFRSLGFEPLEGRRLLTSIVVTTASDAVSHSGVSLRDAVATANADAKAGTSDTITFNSSLNGQTITLAQGELELGLGGVGAGVITINGGNQITLSGNHASRIFEVDSGVTAQLIGLTITAGSAQYGAGLHSAGMLTISSDTFSGNATTGSGGGGNGGGIANDGSLSAVNSTFVANSGTYGGGIANSSTGIVTVSNSTFYANSAANGGGGINSDGTLTISNSTVSGNAVTAGNGGGIHSTGTLTLLDTLVARNSAGTADPDVAGVVQSASTNNLIGDGTGLSGITNGSGGNQVGTTASPIDPKLGPLDYYGGPTETMAIFSGSPAIDAGAAPTHLTALAGTGTTTLSVALASAIASTAGSYVIQIDSEQLLVTNVNLSTNTLTVTRGYNGTTAAGHAIGSAVLLPLDQNGRARVGAPDIGAYEANAVPYGSQVVTTLSDAAAHSGVSLRDAIALAEADAANGVSDTITFAPALSGETITLAQGQLELAGAGTGVVTINGAGQITLTAATGSRVFQVDAGVTAAMLGLAMANSNVEAQGYGGADIYNLGVLAITNCTFSQNQSAAGGAIYNSGTMTIDNSTFSGNSGDGGVGGGIYNSSTLTVSNSTFSGNSGNSGGGIYNDSGTATVSNSTFAGNTASYGGGIHNFGGAFSVSNSTFAGNTASYGGGIYSDGGTLALLSTIVAGNTAGVNVPDIDGAVQSTSTNNLVGDGTGMTGITNGTNGNKVGTSASPINPRLQGLGYDGGATETMPLLSSSPARNAGGNVANLSAITDSASTTITVVAPQVFAAATGLANYLIRVDNEIMQVTNVNVSTNTLTVVRGVNGTAAAGHSAGAYIYWAADQNGSPRDASPDIGAFEYQPLFSTVAPLPAIAYANSFLVTWSGHRASDGPNVASYTVYVSDNGGAYTVWQTATTAPAAIFTGQFGHTYSFYSVATDLSGNVQTTPSGAQATTTLQLVPPAINNLGGTVNYTVGSPATLVASGATVTAGSNTLGDAVLKVALTGSSGSADTLTILAGNGVTLNKTTILYNGTSIGVFQAGAGASPLIVQFYISATTAAVQAVLDDVAFYNTNASASIFDRTASFTITDSSNTSSSAVSKTIHFVAAPPVLGGISGTVNYAPGAGATVVASGATVTAGTNGLAAAKLSVGLGSNAGSADRVTVVAGGGITINGTQLLYNGTVIATFAAGSGSTPLVVQFNASATTAAVQAVLDDVAYYNTNSSMSVYDRTINFTLTDSKGVASNVATKTIHVT
ncbi:MAG TPA: right-handed parallel beta-helix repeat-containing protein [Pirellulales bacterium]|nr:right-handed parallel beta-helix repeat-containing protein [Pirellulales bacterium]